VGGEFAATTAPGAGTVIAGSVPARQGELRPEVTRAG
jgi:hypothetical protein